MGRTTLRISGALIGDRKEESSSKIGSRPQNSNHGKYYRIHKFPYKCQGNIWFACNITEFNPKCLGGCTFPLIFLMFINNLKKCNWSKFVTFTFNCLQQKQWEQSFTAFTLSINIEIIRAKSIIIINLHFSSFQKTSIFRLTVDDELKPIVYHRFLMIYVFLSPRF